MKIKSEIVSQYFGRLIKELSEKFGQKTVILIDEYDKPITDHLDDPETAEKLREFLKSVFVRMKGNDAHIRFVLLTGVSKFSKVSLFSGMNQITDISMNEKYASLLGYTQEELELYFPEYIEILAQKKELQKGTSSRNKTLV
ncbi:MAG: AAA family ATPase [Ignavibacteriales bacterium]|nr:AAA family ATPase [Ignavibacteriales bacterium]